MKNLKNIKFFIFLLTLTLFVTENSFCNNSVVRQGFYPVSSKGEFCQRVNAYTLPHNPLYKEWCQKNFINGSFIYEAYRQIAFYIEYIPEPPRVDYWQTPYETIHSRKGDCEDAILLFHDLLPSKYDNGEIIWGIVSDLKSRLNYAHVWFQLYDIRGNPYIIEPFSGDWNGIIPVELLNNEEIRQQIIGISNIFISNLMDTPSKHQSIKQVIVEQVVMYDWRLMAQIDDVFTKLAQVSKRYRRQMER